MIQYHKPDGNEFTDNALANTRGFKQPDRDGIMMSEFVGFGPQKIEEYPALIEATQKIFQTPEFKGKAFKSVGKGEVELGTEEEKKESCAGLNSASGYLRRVLGKQLRLRNTPKITFYYDETLEYSDHMGQVFHGIKGDETGTDNEDE